MFADTAKLAVDLSLTGNFTSGIATASRQLSGLDRSVSGAARRMGLFGHAVSTALGVGLERVVSAGIRSLIGGVQAGNRSLEELEAVGLRTNAVLKSTGGIAGQTASGIRSLSESLEDLSTNDDKAIQNAANLLLTFTNVRKEAFEPALRAILDMNAALGGGDAGLQGVAIQVGKALQDPVRGLTALRRVGVAFNEEQEAQIKALVKTGDLYAAQKIVLAELSKEFGGQAGAFGTGRAADVRRLQDALEDFQRELATGLAPAVDAARLGLTTFLRDPEVLQMVKDVGAGIASIFTAANIQTGIDAMKEAFRTIRDVLPSLKEGLQISGQVLSTAVGLFKSLPPELQRLAIGAFAVNKLTGGLLTNLAGIALSGLRTITAANVTVIGGNVMGAGAAGAAAASGGIGAIIRTWLPRILIAGIAAEVVYAIFGTQLQDFVRQYVNSPIQRDENGNPIPKQAGRGLMSGGSVLGPPVPFGATAAGKSALMASIFGTHAVASGAFGSPELRAFRGTPEGAIALFDERIKYLAGAQGAGAGSAQYLSVVSRDIAALKSLLPNATDAQKAAITGEIKVLEGILSAKKFEVTAPALQDAVKSQETKTSDHLEANRIAIDDLKDTSYDVVEASRATRSSVDYARTTQAAKTDSVRTAIQTMQGAVVGAINQIKLSVSISAKDVTNQQNVVSTYDPPTTINRGPGLVPS